MIRYYDISVPLDCIIHTLLDVAFSASVDFSGIQTSAVGPPLPLLKHYYVELDCLASVCAKRETRDIAALGPVRAYRQMLDSV